MAGQVTGRKAVVWLFDHGSEGFFAPCLYSLAKNCPSFWNESLKVVVDCGVSQRFREWLSSQNHFLNIVRPHLPKFGEVLGGESVPAARVMRLRIELSRILADAAGQGAIPYFSEFLQCDPDILFLGDPAGVFEMPWEGEDIRCVQEWDWHGPLENNRQQLMPLFRDSTFRSGVRHDDRAAIARSIDIEEAELTCITTVNSGVWAARTESELPEKWLKSYQSLKAADACFPGGMFSPYAAEQNALSLGIYKGLILPRYLPRKYNYLPPREQFAWPEDVCIAHFVTFRRNWTRTAYRVWSRMRAAAISDGFVPAQLAAPEFIDP